MNKKSKGFTVLELIIALGLIVVILGVIYLFYSSNSKTLKTTEIKSDLQVEAEKIQKELFKYGTQAKEIEEIYDENKFKVNIDDKNYASILDSNGKLIVSELKLKGEGEESDFVYDKSKSTITLNGKVLSTYVKEFKIRPLKYNMNPDDNFRAVKELEISLLLNEKSGQVDVTRPLSVIVKFRN